jgi:hypothetical protein
MRLPRLKILRVQFESIGPSSTAPACEDVQLTAVLEQEDGTTVERTRMVLVYPRILSDPEQFPFLMAGELRALMESENAPEDSRDPLP